MMNFWLPNFSDWNQGFDPVDMPWYARYDYVEYWEYVPEADWATTEGANKWHPFKKVWRDDFDTFDTSRWKASDDWTFGVNDVTFWASQVYTEDGALVLKMEPRDGVPGGDDNAGGNDGNTGGNDENTGGNDGPHGNEGDGGATDGTCDCSTHFSDLKATIALLEE